MPFDDDDDLFSEDFDFVDDEDNSDLEEEKSADDTPVEKEASKKGRGKPPVKPAAGPAPRRGRPAPTPAPRREPKRREAPAANEAADDDRAPAPPSIPSDAFGSADDGPGAEEPLPELPAGVLADHVIHVYEHGVFKRTIPRKFTDEEAVGFAEEYTRTGKAYGRYAVATPEDEEPSPTFAGASLS